MKVDVEGNESEVFLGGKKTIEQHKPIIAFENKRDTEDLAQIMRPLLLLEKMDLIKIVYKYTDEEIAEARSLDAASRRQRKSKKRELAAV